MPVFIEVKGHANAVAFAPCLCGEVAKDRYVVMRCGTTPPTQAQMDEFARSLGPARHTGELPEVEHYGPGGEAA